MSLSGGVTPRLHRDRACVRHQIEYIVCVFFVFLTSMVTSRHGQQPPETSEGLRLQKPYLIKDGSSRPYWTVVGLAHSGTKGEDHPRSVGRANCLGVVAPGRDRDGPCRTNGPSGVPDTAVTTWELEVHWTSVDRRSPSE